MWGQRNSKYRGPKKDWDIRSRPFWNIRTLSQLLDLQVKESSTKLKVQVQREVQAGDTNLSTISMSMEFKAETEKEGCTDWKVRQSGRKERPERWEDSRNQWCPRGREKGAY